MATKNIQITEGGWQDLITLGSLSLSNGTTYSVAIRGNGTSEVVLASSKPDNSFMGHPVSADVNFSFTYAGEKIWVKLSPVRSSVTTVVFS